MEGIGLQGNSLSHLVQDLHKWAKSKRHNFKASVNHLLNSLVDANNKGDSPRKRALNEKYMLILHEQ